MKFNSVLLTSVIAMLSIANPIDMSFDIGYPVDGSPVLDDVEARAVETMAPAKNLHRIDLPAPTDWVAGPSLFPGNVIAGYNADFSKYNITSWSMHIKKKCEAFTGCTSCLSFAANNSGTAQPGGRFWFGYTFRGGPTTLKNYTRDGGRMSNVRHSRAYTI